MPLFRALAKNIAPMTNANESPTNRLTLFLTEHFSLYSIYSLIGSTVQKPVSLILI